MTRRFQLRPGIAAWLGVTELTAETPEEISTVFLSFENGVTSLNKFPPQVQAEITKHFNTVFSLEHTGWKWKLPSPRAQYMDTVQPWIVEVPDE